MGDYYRLLADGTYIIKVEKPGYDSQSQYVEVNNKEHQSDAQRLDFVLQSASSEQADLRRMLRKFMNKVCHYNSSSFYLFISLYFRINYW